MVLLHSRYHGNEPSIVLLISFVCSVGALVYSLVRRNMMQLIVVGQTTKRRLSRFHNKPILNKKMNDQIVLDAMEVEDEKIDAKLFVSSQKYLDMNKMDMVVRGEPQQEEPRDEYKRSDHQKSHQQEQHPQPLKNRPADDGNHGVELGFTRLRES